MRRKTFPAYMTIATNLQLREKGWWMKVAPLAGIDPERWVCSIYKKGKVSWITEECKSFNDPESAYEWAWDRICELNKK